VPPEANAGLGMSLPGELLAGCMTRGLEWFGALVQQFTLATTRATSGGKAIDRRPERSLPLRAGLV
jgi:hypothetical protein